MKKIVFSELAAYDFKVCMQLFVVTAFVSTKGVSRESVIASQLTRLSGSFSLVNISLFSGLSTGNKSNKTEAKMLDTAGMGDKQKSCPLFLTLS